MLLLKSADDVASQLKKIRKSGSLTGFVPTMGALHEGHISLLKNSKQICGISICSIFVNPTQFNNPDDFKKYPVTLEHDIYMLEKNGCDILFVPGINEIYPEGKISKKHFDLGNLESILEGEFRPGHFQGVCQVVNRLLEIVYPTHLFIGQKDYQQSMVIKKLLELEHLNIELIICPTLREENGLAMSSRNMRLSKQQKEQAAEIYKTLINIKNKIKPGSLNHLKEEAKDYLSKKNFNPDYVEIAYANNLKSVNEWDGSSDLIALAAAFVNEVRLIDNVLIKV